MEKSIMPDVRCFIPICYHAYDMADIDDISGEYTCSHCGTHLNKQEFLRKLIEIRSEYLGAALHCKKLIYLRGDL